MLPVDADVPSSIDLRDLTDAAEWAATADAKRPWRAELRAVIVELVRSEGGPCPRVLELGPGPGLLAESVLATCEVEHYTLFDFSAPMLAMCGARLGDRSDVSYVLGDYAQPGWAHAVAAPFDVVVSMQAVHEVRNKLRVSRLYGEIREVLASNGMLVVCDHEPTGTFRYARALQSTEAEQHASFRAAGFEDIVTSVSMHDQYVCLARRP